LESSAKEEAIRALAVIADGSTFRCDRIVRTPGAVSRVCALGWGVWDASEESLLSSIVSLASKDALGDWDRFRCRSGYVYPRMLVPIGVASLLLSILLTAAAHNEALPAKRDVVTAQGCCAGCAFSVCCANIIRPLFVASVIAVVVSIFI
jgi:hypothetical protein